MTTTTVRRPNRTHDGPVALAVAILTGSENLSGAACVGRARLFDPDVSHDALGFSSPSAREAAVAATCISCPARGRCWAWASELTQHRRVTGPTAATSGIAETMRARRPGRPRSKASATPEDPDPEPSRPRRSQRRGARSRVRPSIHRRRRR